MCCAAVSEVMGQERTNPKHDIDANVVTYQARFFPWRSGISTNSGQASSDTVGVLSTSCQVTVTESPEAGSFSVPAAMPRSSSSTLKDSTTRIRCPFTKPMLAEFEARSTLFTFAATALQVQLPEPAGSVSLLPLSWQPGIEVRIG